MAREPLHRHTNTNAQMVTGPSRLVSVMFSSGGGAVSNIRLYDNTAASGRIVLELDASKNGVFSWALPTDGLAFTNGLYCDLGGATSCTIIYQD